MMSVDLTRVNWRWSVTAVVVVLMIARLAHQRRSNRTYYSGAIRCWRNAALHSDARADARVRLEALRKNGHAKDAAEVQ